MRSQRYGPHSHELLWFCIRGHAVVTYKQQKAKPAEGEEENDQSDVVTFEQLNVQLEDGTEFSALASYAGDETVVAHQKSSSLGKKLFLPVG